MAVLESYIEKKVIAAAEAAGFMQRKVKYINRNGAPDRWFFGPTGQFLLLPNGQTQRSDPTPQRGYLNRGSLWMNLFCQDLPN